MTSRRDLPASDPVRRLRMVAAALCAVLALVVSSPLVHPAGAAAVAGPTEQRTESVLDPNSAESAAPERRARSRTDSEQSIPHSADRAFPGRADLPARTRPEHPVVSHVPDLLPPGRAPPSHSD